MVLRVGVSTKPHERINEIVVTAFARFKKKTAHVGTLFDAQRVTEVRMTSKLLNSFRDFFGQRERVKRRMASCKGMCRLLTNPLAVCFLDEACQRQMVCEHLLVTIAFGNQ